MRTKRRSCVFVLLGLALAGPVAPAESAWGAEPEPPEEGGEFAAAVAALVAGAEIGTDDEYDAYKREARLLPGLVAPRRMRSFTRTPETGRRGLDLRMRCRDGRLSLTYLGELRVRAPDEQAPALLREALERAELKDVEGALATYLAAEYRDLFARLAQTERDLGLDRESLYGPWTYARRAGAVREELFLPSFVPGVGGREPVSVGDFRWAVECDYPHAPPTLEEVLKAFPGLQPLHFEPGLYELLRSQPANEWQIDCSPNAIGDPRGGVNTGWTLVTSASVQPDFEAALRACGFDYEETVDLPSNFYGTTTQQFWPRQTEEASTYASIITLRDHPDLILLSCMCPQPHRKAP